MTIEAATLLTKVTLIVLCMSLVMSIIIMFGGNNIFKKASKGDKSANIPIMNLFVMLDVCDMSAFFGVLFFIPFANLIVFMIMGLKLGKVFNTGFGYKLGLIFMPFMFYPLLAYSDKQYKVTDEEYFRALDNAKEESIHLMTQEEVQMTNTVVVDEGPQIDSIFKTDIQTMEDVAPYKATQVDLLGMEKLRSFSTDEEIFKPIDIVPQEKIDALRMSEEKEVNKPTFTAELERDDDVEVVDL